MLIDEFLPDYEVNERHQIVVRAPLETAYAAARNLDMRESPIVRWLFRWRGLPKYSLTFEGMLKLGFILLADEQGREIVFGLIGRFWTRSAGIQNLTAAEFVRFAQPGFAKAVGNIAFDPLEDGRVRVTTETRVHGLDQASRRRFRLYWFVIAPFSGLIRKEWLRLIKKRAELSTGRV
ncbi:MAG: hypothetical protein AB1641_22310 [Thermodesulfobacteriota bacterium]